MGEFSRLRHRAEIYEVLPFQSPNSEVFVFVEPSSGLVEVIPQSQIQDWRMRIPRELINQGRYELRARTPVRRLETPALLRVIHDFSALRISV